MSRSHDIVEIGDAKASVQISTDTEGYLVITSQGFNKHDYTILFNKKAAKLLINGLKRIYKEME